MGGDRRSTRQIQVDEGPDVNGPPDTGCDWRRLSEAFAMCATCPLPKCRVEYPWREQVQAAALVALLLAGQPPHPRPRPLSQSPAALRQRKHRARRATLLNGAPSS